MKQLKSLIGLTCTLLIVGVKLAVAQQQNTSTNNYGWHLKDEETDHFWGISLQQAYQFLQSKQIKGKPVTVAVLDSGIDTTHEDLKSVMWTNPFEIPNNGVDDDKNGYIDDVHGWNFLGNKSGVNLNHCTEEAARMYYYLKPKFEQVKPSDTLSMSDWDKYLFNQWQTVLKKLEVDADAMYQTAALETFLKAIKKYQTYLQQALHKDTFKLSEIEPLNTSNDTKDVKTAKTFFINFIKISAIEPDETNVGLITELEQELNRLKLTQQAKDEPPTDYRKQTIGDDEHNIHDEMYGNNDIMSTESKHGTHVAGIIAAQRDNGIGVDGVADLAKIMAVRVVPDGDEYDKDIALGIFYAVKQGARVINMSFGKSLSPHKNWIDSAMAYALQKDVLIIHSAGNDNTNIDSTASFPNAYTYNNKQKFEHIITVGASSNQTFNKGSIVADFSNYGKMNVDVFAPGDKIYSTIPNSNQYGFLKGTSMAAPIVSGIAALIRSYFPKLTALQVKECIVKTVKKPSEAFKIYKPGTDMDEVDIAELANYPGVVNAYEAVKYAYQLSAKHN